MVKNAFIPPGECPVCGESVPRGARACPGCGADERSGWDEESTRYDGLDLPDDAWADRDEPAPRAGGRRWLGIVAVVLLIALLLTLVFR